MPIRSPLRWFALSEFRHPDLVLDEASVWLDDIRDAYGHALVLTSDARTPEENAAASGSSPTSWHLQGRAFDLRYPPTPELVWAFVRAVVRVSGERPVELELVHSAADSHLHLALLPEGRPSRLLVQAD